MNRMSVVLRNGKERQVTKDELQFLLVTDRVMFFERSDGWVVCGRDTQKMRMCSRIDFPGEERRTHSVYALSDWH